MILVVLCAAKVRASEPLALDSPRSLYFLYAGVKVEEGQLLTYYMSNILVVRSSRLILALMRALSPA
jgi:hypothetical protein